MPISYPIEVRDLSRAEFDERDQVVMGCAYATQNALGRLCDEQVYENDLALRLRLAGWQNVHTQVPVTVNHGTFEKIYRLDLVVDHALYELKTVRALLGEHDSQVLHYAMLLGVGHGKLLNFRSSRVQGKLRFNALSQERRHCLQLDETNWHPLSNLCVQLKSHCQNLLHDWGAFLDFRLFNEALIHFCGGEERCLRRVPVKRAGHELGTHRLQCHDEGACFVVTAMTENASAYEDHLTRLLSATGMRGIQWMNLNNNQVSFRTIQTIKRMETSE